MKKIMGVDLGRARTGIAMSDYGCKMAFPREVIHEWNEQRLIDKIADFAMLNDIGEIVVGLPINMDGSHGDRAHECERLSNLIAERTKLPVRLWDERCSTVCAYNAFDEAGKFGKKRRETVDAAAAAVILQSYLDSKI